MAATKHYKKSKYADDNEWYTRPLQFINTEKKDKYIPEPVLVGKPPTSGGEHLITLDDYARSYFPTTFR